MKHVWRTLRAALGLSLGVAFVVIVTQISLFGSNLAGGAFFLCPVMGFAAAYQMRRVWPDISWREILAALPLAPLLAALIAWLPCLALKSGFNIEEACVYSAAASIGIFLLPIFDNDLRQKEPEVAISRKTTGLITIAILIASLLNAFLVPVLNQTQHNQSGYNALGTGVIALFTVFAGWVAALAGARKHGAQMMAWGSLAAVAAILVLDRANVSF